MYRDVMTSADRTSRRLSAAVSALWSAPAWRATGNALAIEYGLLPEGHQREHAGAKLAEVVLAGGYHISTGFVGTPLICDALCDAGYFDAAYRLLMQRDCP